MHRSMMFIVVIMLMFSGCSSQEAAPVEKTPDDVIEMTMEEVAQFNGENDIQAYVIVDGEIYDVTDHPNWGNGTHGGNIAGSDITEMLDNNATHGRDKLDEIDKIGIIIE